MGESPDKRWKPTEPKDYLNQAEENLGAEASNLLDQAGTSVRDGKQLWNDAKGLFNGGSFFQSAENLLADNPTFQRARDDFRSGSALFSDVNSLFKDGNLARNAERLLKDGQFSFNLDDLPNGAEWTAEKTASGVKFNLRNSQFDFNLDRDKDAGSTKLFADVLGSRMGWQTNESGAQIDFDSAPLGTTLSIKKDGSKTTVSLNNIDFETNPLGQSLTLNNFLPQGPLRVEMTPDGRLKLKETARSLFQTVEENLRNEMPSLSFTGDINNGSYSLNADQNFATAEFGSKQDTWSFSAGFGEKHSFPSVTDTLFEGGRYSPKFFTDMAGSVSLRILDPTNDENQTWFTAASRDLSHLPVVGFGHSRGENSFSLAAGPGTVQGNADIGFYSLGIQRNSERQGIGSESGSAPGSAPSSGWHAHISRKTGNNQFGITAETGSGKFGVGLKVDITALDFKSARRPR